MPARGRSGAAANLVPAFGTAPTPPTSAGRRGGAALPDAKARDLNRDRARSDHRPAVLLRWAVLLLGVSVLARLLWMLVSPNGMNLVDLHVYVDGSAALLTDRLYDFTYAEKTPDFPLPFTYPPFAALVFFPLHYLPFTVIAIGWLLAIVAALFGVVWIALELLVGRERMRETPWRVAAVGWTTVGVWMEPVRTTMDYGQVNVFLVLGAMLAVRSTRWWIAGGLVGVIAGIKLTPAITGLYFVARRRWGTAVWSAVVFGATVGVSYLINDHEATRYFGTLLGDADRIGPVGSVWNQSLRGALSRVLGYDVESGPVWIGAVLVVAALAWFAWRALGPDDRLGTLLLVQLFGLMVSPISWSHHWVWLLPTVLWLVYGPLRDAPGARLLAGYWLVTTLIGVPWVLSFFQPTIWEISRPGLLAWLGAVDVAGVLVFLVWVIVMGPRRAEPAGSPRVTLRRRSPAEPAEPVQSGRAAS
ncbi:mannosyltransferase [Nocardia puris]|uniref:Alpha-1,2-mannosyltransferase n=1 Tax=Nocardia puris TaxID=208602 RepID=A0A366DU04_9NOCA|nr:mannosyltransferase [Nocardia puris]MBF6459352.1 mannosyltransferase [Nocardia puris]RBO92688.1 alpha-1,2-mannosyltransferase [Nocardia puris]